MKPLRILIFVALLIAATIGSSQIVLASSEKEGHRGVHLVATIHGAGTADMDAGGLVSGKTVYSFDAKLYSDGSVIGKFDCIDLPGALIFGQPADGDVFGTFTSWTKAADGKITLHSTDGQFRDPLHPETILDAGPFVVSVTIQKFGGAGKGHWTMHIPAFEGGGPTPTCSELVTSGRLVIRQYDWDEEGTH